MTSTIIFLSMFLSIASFMLIIKININFDLKNYFLIIEIKVFSLKIITIKIDLIFLRYKINNSKYYKSLDLIINKEQEYLILQIKNSILDKLYYDDIKFSSSINMGDCALTANIIGVLDLLCILFDELFFQKIDIRFIFKNRAEFIEKENNIKIFLKVYFTIFDMIFAIIMSFYKRGKYVKKRKQTRN